MRLFRSSLKAMIIHLKYRLFVQFITFITFLSLSFASTSFPPMSLKSTDVALSISFTAMLSNPCQHVSSRFSCAMPLIRSGGYISHFILPINGTGALKATWSMKQCKRRTTFTISHLQPSDHDSSCLSHTHQLPAQSAA